MSTTIEWAHANAGLTLITSDESAPDGLTPDDGEASQGNIALVVDGCAIMGQPGELLELLSDAVAKVSAHLAGTN